MKQKVHAKGKLTARERIYALLDDDSFVELDALARHRGGGGAALWGTVDEFTGDGIMAVLSGRPQIGAGLAALGALC